MDASDAHDPLTRGRDAFRRRSWDAAYRQLSAADRTACLHARDLGALADAAHLSGRDEEGLALLERTFRAHLEADEPASAARCAFWLGFRIADRGDIGQATGWFGRAHRLAQHEPNDGLERAYLLLPAIQGGLASGDYDASFTAAERAASTGERYGDGDLVALALHAQGRVRLRQGRVDEGLALLDEAMVAVTADELSPTVAGVIYCSVIAACQEVYALDRAQEWTAALTRWCGEQPELVPFSGQCLVHRSAVMELRGQWRDALEEARRARERAERGEPLRVVAAAWYQQAELHRLLGEFGAAEHAYLQAARSGREPQPGLALLWWARGELQTAASTLRRVEREASLPLKRTRVLPDYIEVMLATGDLPDARRALTELEGLSAEYRTEVLAAIVAEVRGAVLLATDEPAAALSALREACACWEALDAPHRAGRVRWRIGHACRAMGDDATATLEIDAARSIFTRLGAAPDLARLDAARAEASTDGRQVLTARELQVLRLIAAGHTNRTIADELAISRRTVDRHVSNIFDKLSVSSRAAATAHAYEHDLV